MEWTVVIHPDAETELGRLPTREQDAIATAVAELRAEGPTLGYPHTSEVRAVHGLRELRPRRGHSRWRAFYRQIDHALVIGAIGPEAEADPKRFKRAVEIALQRLEITAHQPAATHAIHSEHGDRRRH
ncbi:MAG TPA: type II toxin-antitoxin system RelE/ParE family toxin [Micromonosporaceae bacterium]|jgi:hypothetical protein|nr:type II toxin-antitoxin system RelE/ParE family toxin [Micromonosporaceae bacterium]